METFLPLTATLGFTYYDSSSDDSTFFAALTFLTGFFGCYSSDYSELVSAFFTIFFTFGASFEGFLGFGFYDSDYSSDEESFLIGFLAICLAFFTSFFEGATIGTLSYSSLDDSTTGFFTAAVFFAMGFLGASSEDDSSD